MICSLLSLEYHAYQFGRAFGERPMLPRLERHSPALSQIGGHIALKTLCNGCVADGKVNFIIDSE
jgi:hypothetical protein